MQGARAALHRAIPERSWHPSPTHAQSRREAADMISDETAYRRYLRGDQEAADLMVERHGDALMLYISACIKDMHEAEDLMIEAFARIFAKERPIRGEGAFKAYLYRTARNLALRHLKKHRFIPLRIEALNFEPQFDRPVEAELDRSEDRRQLYLALRKLKPEYREALYLVYFAGLSYRSSGAVMGKSETQITNLVHRGKRSLKQILEREGFTYADE